MPKIRVLKAADTEACNVVAIDRESLQDFPREAVNIEGSEAEALHSESLREAVLAEIRAEAECKVQEAYSEAYQRGWAAGEEAFRCSVAHAADLLEDAAQKIREARLAFLDSLEPQVLELSVAIAERVLSREVRTDPELIKSTIRRALLAISDRQQIRLRVHSADYDALREHQVKLLEEFPAIQSLEVCVDEEVSPGGCILESQLMQVDARWETLLGNVLESLTEQ